MNAHTSALPRGAGRSYGDTAVIGNGRALTTGQLREVITFDPESGAVEAESGVTLGQLNEEVVAHGWIVPCCPGTAEVTLGGMVASDVHGKNHHRSGTIGEHVLAVSLARSDRGSIRCTQNEQPELFRATLGGLGLTGVIESVRLQLAPLAGRHVRIERTRCRSIAAALELLRDTENYDYGLAWVDSFSLRSGDRAQASARCIVLRAIVLPDDTTEPRPNPRALRLAGAASKIAPPFLFRRAPMRLVNHAYFRGKNPLGPDVSTTVRPLSEFLFPQDEAHSGNRIYGRRGVYAHQSLIPDGYDGSVMDLLRLAGRPGEQSLVTVLKVFSGRRSGPPGLLSFTGKGTSIALGFQNDGERTRQQLDALDGVVLEAGGMLYPAKDARMSAASFARSFPRVEEFAPHVDPVLSSNFWRRVAPGVAR